MIREEEDEENARQELGSYKKPKTPINPYKHFKSPAPIIYVSDQIIDERKQRLLPLLETLKKQADGAEEKGPCLQLKIRGYMFDFWPASDTYYVHSTCTYGYGIEKLCSQIQAKLLANG